MKLRTLLVVLAFASLARADVYPKTADGTLVPGGTAFPSVPRNGDLFYITDDSAAGACDSAAGAVRTLCRWNGSVWQAAGDGGGAGTGDVTDVGNCINGACFGGASGTTLTSTTGEVLDMGTVNTMTFRRDDAGSVTIQGGDNSSPADTIFDTTGPGAITVGSADVTSVTVTTDGTGNAEVVLPNESIGAAEIQDNIVAAAELAATLTFADGDFVDLSAINGSGTVEGLKLPQAANCTASTAEGQICWDSDDDTLRVGNGTTTTAIGSGGSAPVDEPFSSGWNADVGAPEKDDVYDWGHVMDPDDDGRVSVLEQAAAGIVNTDASGNTLTPLASTGTGNVARAADPVFTGNPQAPDQSQGDNDDSIANTQFVNAEIVADVAALVPTKTYGTGLPPGTCTQGSQYIETDVPRYCDCYASNTWGCMTLSPP